MGATTDNDYCPNCGSIHCSGSCYNSRSDSYEPETVNRPETVNDAGVVVEGVKVFGITVGVLAIVVALVIDLGNILSRALGNSLLRLIASVIALLTDYHSLLHLLIGSRPSESRWRHPATA